MANSYRYISTRCDRDVLILTIELPRVNEYAMAEAVGKELIDAAHAQRATKVVVDLGQLQYMSSVGYGPLISLRSRVRENGGRLVLCNLSEVVHEMFDATRLLINPRSPKSLFEFTDTVESAMALLTNN
jgi:anti-anti-sigma factor